MVSGPIFFPAHPAVDILYKCTIYFLYICTRISNDQTITGTEFRRDRNPAIRLATRSCHGPADLRCDLQRPPRPLRDGPDSAATAGKKRIRASRVERESSSVFRGDQT